MDISIYTCFELCIYSVSFAAQPKNDIEVVVVLVTNAAN